MLAKGDRHPRRHRQLDPADSIEGAGVYTSGASDEVMQFVRSFRPIRRMGTLDDVANAAEYLVSDLASFISGQHLLLSGGGPA